MAKKDNSYNSGNWLMNLDKIEDSTRRNYFARLPQEEAVLKFYSEAFVINKPKGSVGGDGFWLHNHGDDVYLALFTCVGEGHLANMMIRIYMEALKKMVEGFAIDFTGSILQFVHREVQARFKNKNNILLNTNANIGIVKLNMKTKEMVFAGANMDLIQITNGKAKIIKGDNKQVGETGEQHIAYSSNTLTEVEQSSFYLCSSGVNNLIGGKAYKNLKQEDLSRFLTTLSGLDLMLQRESISEFLSDWTGSNRQNDDILVIGFKA